MKKVFLAGSALVAAMTLASAAQAADMMAAPAYDWTGFYVGVNAGGAWNNSSVKGDFYAQGVDLLKNRIDASDGAFTAGGMLGYNYQIDHLVLGAEADFNYLGFNDSDSQSNYIAHAGADVGITGKYSYQTDWFGTIRGRLGFAVDNMLFYGTGGLAYGNVQADGKVKVTINGDTYDTWQGSDDSTNWGWTAGAGMEYGIDNWSLGAEYLYVNLGSSDFNDKSYDSQIGHSYELKGSADYAFSLVRATVKYRF